ncbi:MAG: sensor histidine kinase [Spirochaetales bacterium]|nr:sensor histidine kinase [Spirochaetales bacterium]
MYNRIMSMLLRKIALALLFTVLLSAPLSADEKPLSHSSYPNVLLLQSYHQGYKWSDELCQGVLEVLQDEAEIHIEYMDTKKYFSTEYLERTKNYLQYKSAKINYDLIIASDNYAFEFLKKHRTELYGDIPVVFTGVNFLDSQNLQGFDNITGISEENNFRGTLRVMQKLFPQRKNLICILDESVTGMAVRKGLEKSLPEFEKEFDKIEIWSDLSMNDLVRDLGLLGDDFIVFNIYFQKDNQGEYFEYNHSNRIIGEATNVPVFGSWDFQFPYGIVGGYLLRGVEQGREAGQMAKRILDGEDVNSIPVIWNTPHHYMFDFEKLLAYSIRIDDLPRNSIIINLPDTIFHQYYTETTIVLIAFIILLAFIFMLQQNIQKRKAGEKALSALNDSLNERVEQRTKDLEESNDSLNNALEQLKSTQKALIRKERLAALGSLVSGVAHELNTPLGVGITTSSYIIDLTAKLEKQLKSNTLTREGMDEFIDRIKQGSSLLEKNLNKTASLIDSFKNLSFDETAGECLDFDLMEYLEEVVRTQALQFNNQNIRISLTGNPLFLRSYPGSFYHVINNLLLNSMTHGFEEELENKQISINLKELEGQSGMIEYRDNGKGIPLAIKEHMFEPFTTGSRLEGKTGLGLYIIFKTVNEKLGGAVEYQPAEEGAEREGVCFRIYFPIERPMDNC